MITEETILELEKVHGSHRIVQAVAEFIEEEMERRDRELRRRESSTV